MKQTEKLRILLPHWIEHNNGHEEECKKWSMIARDEGLGKIADYIDQAISAMTRANDLLKAALEEAGGDAHDGGHHHHHHDH